MSARPTMHALALAELASVLAAVAPKPPVKAKRKAAAKAPERNAWVKASSWYGRAVANDRAAEARRSQRAPRARSSEADAQARTYAEWLLERDGRPLAVLALEAVEAHNAAHPPKLEGRSGRKWDSNEHKRLTDGQASVEARVWWEPTAHGYRQRFVTFELAHHNAKRREVVRVELPNWAAAWEVVEDLTESALLAA